MKSGWVERDAQAIVDRYAHQGVGPDLALRIYTTRLLGRDPKLVLHGGGNTSVKTVAARPPRRGGRGALRQGLGRRHGDDRAGRPAGGAARASAQAARARPRSPTATWCASSARICSIRWRPTLRSRCSCTPSCRTSSSTTPMRSAVLSLVDQPDGEPICADVYDGRVGIVPYLMPGFALASKAGGRLRRKAQGRRPDPAQARHRHVRRHRARSL